MLTSPPSASSDFDFDTPVDRSGTSSMKWERYPGRDVLPFWVADMDFAVAKPIRAALAERLEHPIFGYTVAPPSTRDAVLAFLDREHDWQVDPDWLVWLPGVVSGLAVAARAYCADGDEIIVNPPIYHHFFDAHDPRRHRLVHVPLGAEADGRRTWDIDAMRAACTDRSRLLMLCSPHNPTTTVFQHDEVAAIMALAEEQNLIVVSDEIHCDLVLADTRHQPTANVVPELAHRTITLMSASKTWNIAGLNASFAVIPDAELRERFKQSMQSIVAMVPPLAYVATEAAYAHGNPWRLALLDYLRGNLQSIESALDAIPGLELKPLEATYLAWIDATALGLDDTTAHFEDAGIGLSSGEQFGEPGFIRLNFACSRQLLQRGLERLAEGARR